MSQGAAGCPLCESAGGTLLVRTPRWRLIRADEAGFPAFYRVVWNAHVAEFSELSADERRDCMEAVATVEAVLRRHLRPTKVNLAALGNMVAHLHWHVVARFEWDSHFPTPVWGVALREAPAWRLAEVEAARADLEHALVAALSHAP
ncbi:HIT family protein [Ramlibacter sp.]|uniref:HIT family protein n=1 Tax=Ramlibacter sp. TaxID=1917967 RepID=UPI003D0D79AB